MQATRSVTNRWAWLAVALLALSINLEARAQADSSQPSTKVEAEATAEQPAEKPTADPEATEQTRRVLKTIAYTVLLGGLVLIALLWRFVLVMGRQTRRAVRKAPAEPSEVDELWYLHPAKKPASSSTPAESSDEESADDDPGNS